MTVQTETSVTVVLPYCAPSVEAHLTGCKASTRRVKQVETEVLYTTTVGDLLKMQANPDEGHFKVHTCLKPHLG